MRPVPEGVTRYASLSRTNVSTTGLRLLLQPVTHQRKYYRTALLSQPATHRSKCDDATRRYATSLPRPVIVGRPTRRADATSTRRTRVSGGDASLLILRPRVATQPLPAAVAPHTLKRVGFSPRRSHATPTGIVSRMHGRNGLHSCPVRFQHFAVRSAVSPRLCLGMQSYVWAR